MNRLLPTMMNFTMTMMDTQTNRARRLIKMLERLIEKDYLYSDEEMKLMKSQLRMIKEELNAVDTKNSKGFGK